MGDINTPRTRDRVLYCTSRRRRFESLSQDKYGDGERKRHEQNLE